jgi:aryl-alcohol dehydrogenase-like predicted oxidoreductase
MDLNSSSAGASGTVALGPLTVNRLGFGAMRITGPGIWGEPADIQGAVAVLRRAVELGCNFIDTADSYGPDVSERLIGEALSPYPAGLVIATKGGLTRPRAGSWERDAHPAHLRSACEGSLRRLKLACIDLYQLHAPDPRVPFEESVGELVRLREAGKIRLIGLSNVSVAEIERARALTPIVSVQNRHDVDSDAQDPVLEYCAAAGIAFIPWGPLGSGRHADASAATAGRGASRLAGIAARHGITPGQAAIAWLLARSKVMLPIPGTSSLAHLEENVAAAAVRLTAADLGGR